MKFIYILLLTGIIQFSVSAQDLEADSLILVEFYNAFNGENWGSDYENWLSDEPLNDWKGVNVNQDRVVKLFIRDSSLMGSFPSSFFDLDQLKQLDIWYGDISGGIPEDFVEFNLLFRLVLQWCNLDGTIPEEIIAMESLKVLSFRGNNLTGSLPEQIGSSIELFYLPFNNLTGTIPESWEGSTVKRIELENNQLTGNFDILSTFKYLEAMDLCYNDWDASTFPLWVDDSLYLRSFHCSGCNLYGEIPSELDFTQNPYFNLMILADNNLSGDASILFPSDAYVNNFYFDISNNEFSGEFPAHKLNKIGFLRIQDNHFSSISDFKPDASCNDFNIRGNDFTFSSLAPLEGYIESDTIISITYDSMSPILSKDTILITGPTSLTFASHEDDPSTSYNWLKDNEELSLTTAEITIDITDNSSTGVYTCQMKNEKFPALTLQRNNIYLTVEFPINTIEEKLDQVIVFPNPTQNIFTVKADYKVSGKRYKIHTLEGKLVETGIIRTEKTVDISNLDKGQYLLTIPLNNRSINTRIIKL